MKLFEWIGGLLALLCLAEVIHNPKHALEPRYGQRKVRARPVVKHAGEERVISAILDMKAQGLSLRQIASFLSKIGVPTKRKGKAWHPEMVKRILESRSK